jgi:hypothetical protein
MISAEISANSISDEIRKSEIKHEDTKRDMVLATEFVLGIISVFLVIRLMMLGIKTPPSPATASCLRGFVFDLLLRYRP